METQGAQRYVALFEAPFQTSVLSASENRALQASSLMALPPPPPGAASLAGLTALNLPGSSLTQWAACIQDMAMGLRLPPEAVVSCPQADIVGVLNKIENMTLVKYCHFCLRVGRECRCSNVPRQSSSSGSGLWTPPTTSYPVMASSTETTASSSVGGVPPQRHPPVGLSPVDPAVMSYATMASIPEAAASPSAGGVPPQRHPTPGLPPPQQIPMDMLPAPTTENLLAAAGVGRGKQSPATGPRTPTAPGPRLELPTSTHPWMPAPGRQEVDQATPYKQQVHPPRYSSGVQTTTPKTGTTPSTSQGEDETTRGEEGGRGRSSARRPRGQTRDDRSSTRGSVKHRRGTHSENPMDDVSNYVASGWKRDLTHIINCYWKDQVGPLTSSEWTVAINRFIRAMRA